MKYWLSHLPLEVWVDVYRYPWITREELARIVNRFSNRKYAEYLQFYLHDWGKRKLDSLHFDKDYFYKYINDVQSRLHFPQAPMPVNIKTFQRILIYHFDAQINVFMRQIRPILTNVNLYLLAFSPKNLVNLRVILANLLPLLNGIHSLSTNVDALPTVEHCIGMEGLAAIKVLAIQQQGGMDEAKHQTTINFLMNWLLAQQREGNGPKWCDVSMYFDHNGFCEQIFRAIRQDFLAAISPCTFAVSVRSNYMTWQFAEFHLQNSTGEELHGVQTGRTQIQITRHNHKANCGSALQEWIEENTDREKMSGSRQIEIHNPTIGFD